MTYFKNVDLASKYNISEATVRNWVKTAKEGKLDLTLHEEKNRTYVANVPNNIKVIEKLVAQNKKYRNTKSAKTVTPKPEFYKLFDQNQIYDIVRNLEIHHEIPRQYNYFDGGANEWDQYADKLALEDTPNMLNSNIRLVNHSLSYLDDLLSEFDKVNVVDLGVGNALPSKDLLTHLLKNGKLGRYIAIDTSPTMLEIAEGNIKEWFGDEVNLETKQLDITHERFSNLLTVDYANKDKRTANLILLFGATHYNFRNPDDTFRVINESMNVNDFLIVTNKLETNSKLPDWFKRDSAPGKAKLANRHRLVFDLLNIDESFFDMEVGFNENLNQGYTRTKLKIALTLNFEFKDGQHKVEFNKGDTILLWRLWQISPSDIANQLERTGFYSIFSSQTANKEFIMTISQVHGEQIH